MKNPLLLLLLSRLSAAEASAEQEAELDDEGGDRREEAGDRHVHDVMVGDVSELVAQDALQLGLVEQVQKTGGGAHGGRVGGAAHCERVGHRCLGDRHLGHGQVGLDAEPLDRAVEIGRLLGGDLVRAHRGQGELVGAEVLHQEQGAGNDGDSDRAGAGGDEDGDEDDIHEAQQECRCQHPGLEASVATK